MNSLPDGWMDSTTSASSEKLLPGKHRLDIVEHSRLLNRLQHGTNRFVLSMFFSALLIETGREQRG